jgi:hypothetical protein
MTFFFFNMFIQDGRFRISDLRFMKYGPQLIELLFGDLFVLKCTLNYIEGLLVIYIYIYICLYVIYF